MNYFSNYKDYTSVYTDYIYLWLYGLYFRQKSHNQYYQKKNTICIIKAIICIITEIIHIISIIKITRKSRERCATEVSNRHHCIQMRLSQFHQQIRCWLFWLFVLDIIILWIILIIPVHHADGLFRIIPCVFFLDYSDYSVWIILIIPFF